MREPPRYVLHGLEFTDSTAVDCTEADFLCEFLPLDQHSAVLLATPKDWAFGRTSLANVVKGWRGRKQVRAVRYEIRAGKATTRFQHEFKARPGAPRILTDGARLWASRGNLFLTAPLSLLNRRGRAGQKGVQFVN